MNGLGHQAMRSEAEDVPVSVRWQSLIAVMLACVMAGCGGDSSKARFVENGALTKQLLPKARKAVQKTLEDHFGSPLDSVAWLKLPVNYGKAEGTVKSVDGQKLSVLFNAEASDVESLKSPELARAGLLFTSGGNVGKQVLLAKFDSAANLFETLQSLESAPTAGDQFIAAGHFLRHGRKLYARHCQHCHGVSGDGAGSTAKYLNPRPRDYRLGVFKFTSTTSFPAPIKATRDDLKRVIGQGIPGTYMPAFVPMLKEQELVAIIEYVRWLAMRGEIEKGLVTELKGEYSKDRSKDEGIDKSLETYLKEGYPNFINEIAGEVGDKWAGAEEEGTAITPKKPRTEDSVESRHRGKTLFLGNKAKCVNCHGPAGRGNGPMTEDFQKNPDTNEVYAERGLYDVWGQPIKPRDLTRGIYRGGRRPIDIYRRIFAGIKGTPMPANSQALSEDEIWDLVNYALSVPFDTQAPKSAKPQGLAERSTEHGRAH